MLHKYQKLPNNANKVGIFSMVTTLPTIPNIPTIALIYSRLV